MASPKTSTILSKDTKLPPQNLEAESSLLGSVLLDKEVFVRIADIITSEDFYDQKNAHIFSAMTRLFEKRSPIDLITLAEELEKEKKLDDAGGASYLAALSNSVPTAAHAADYATIVSEKATLRRLIVVSGELGELGFKENEELSSILDKAEQSLFSISQKYLKEKFVSLKSVLTDAFNRIDELHKEKGKLRGVPTGFRDLDNILSGLQESDLIVVAARPAMGKTTLALNMALYAASTHKVPSGYFSLEMSKEQMVDRLLSAEAGIDSWKLRTGNLSEEDFEKLGPAMGNLSETPFFIDDTPSLNVMEVRTKARRLQAEHNVGLLVVDYLQLMEGGGRAGADINRVQQISDISRALKGLARELKIPIIAISQLSRAVESRPSHIPQLADLRESGSIEQDADVVMFIYREDYYDPDTEKKNIAKILIKKHRNGPTGEVELYFDGARLSFRNLERQKGEHE